MITPLGWLERVPSYKDQQEQLKEKDLATYGFLGYPLLQSADILIYRPQFVPVGEDQVAHVEITREVARRFNHVYGREPDFESKAEKAVKSLGARTRSCTASCARPTRRRATGPRSSAPRRCLPSNARLTVADRERLLGYLEGTGIAILAEPEVLLTDDPEGAGARRPQDVEVLRQHDRAARGSGRRSRRSSRPCRPTRRACGAPIRATPTSARSGTCTRSIRRRGPGLGCRRLPQRRHRLPRVQEAADRQGGRGDRGIAKRAQEFEDNPELVRGIIAEGVREGARGRARDHGAVRRAMAIELPMKPELTLDAGSSAPTAPARRAARAAAGRDAVRGRRGRAGHRAAARPVHPAAGARGVPRGLRGAARPAAVPDPAAEPRHPRHPDRRDHAPVHAVHRADAGAAARAGRRVPADGGDAGRGQVADAAAAAARRGRPRRTDPRAELVRRLQEYERFKRAAEGIDRMPRLERDTWVGVRGARRAQGGAHRRRRSRCRKCCSRSRT